MTILQALDAQYHRLDKRGMVPKPGWSRVKFGWCIILNKGGEVLDKQNLHDLSGKKPRVKLYSVPSAVKRTVGISPNFLWDKSAYVLGCTAGTSKRTAKEHEAFVTLHLERLADTDDEGLVALRLFLKKWQPEHFIEPHFVPEMLDNNIMFRLDGDKDEDGDPCYIHERPAARTLVEAPPETSEEEGATAFCLISGETAPIARLHRTIKGVEGAQSSGAALVSFNLDAFTSLGMKQGDNAPTSRAAVFRYGAALNFMLTRKSPNRISRPIGDATVVFWADTSDAKAAEAADGFFAGASDPDQLEDAARRKLADDLAAVAKGRSLSDLQRPDLKEGTRFHVLGLSPNAARISVRFWLSDSLDHFAKQLAAHYEDMHINPAPKDWGAAPSVGRLLVRTTAHMEKFDNIPHQLAGEMMRAVLSGTRYPQSLLSAAIIRLRAGDYAASGWHAAVIRGVMFRNQRLKRRNPDIPEKGETPMALNRDHKNPGYQLGRLFAVYEIAQRSALGKVNASIRDKYFGAASATPASVFPIIIRGAQHHLSKVRKEKPGWAYLIEQELEEILGHIDPALPLSLPRSLKLQDQGEFAIGYYHQRATKLTSDKGDEIDADNIPASSDKKD